MSTTNSPTQAPDFVLGSDPFQFTWTVRVPVPGNDDYGHAALKLHFEAVDQAELDRMNGEGLAPGEAMPTEAEIVRRVVKGWPKLLDVTGQSVPFSPEALEKLMRAPVMRRAIVVTYLAAMGGTAARKNG